MSSRTITIALTLAAVLLVAGCSARVDNPDHAACRRAWVKTFNVIFDNSISNSDVRWFQACMTKRGYKRIYNTGRCAKISASIREPRCYAKV